MGGSSAAAVAGPPAAAARSLSARAVVMGLVVAAEGQTLGAQQAVAAGGVLGIGEGAVRVALARLVAAARLQKAGHGRYRLGPAAAELVADVAGWRQAEARIGAWDGRYILAYTGALGRSDRTALRRRQRALAMLGMRELERGLYVRPDNLAGGAEKVRTRLHGLGLDRAAAVFGGASVDAARAAAIAALWDTAALERHYAHGRQALDAWRAGAAALDLQTAARESFQRGNAAIRHVIFDPLLPEAWIDAAARRAYFAAVRRFDAAGQEIWRRLRAGGAATV